MKTILSFICIITVVAVIGCESDQTELPDQQEQENIDVTDTSTYQRDTQDLDNGNSNYVSSDRKIVLTGDSRTQNFPTTKLPYLVINYGKSGSTSVGCVNRLPYYIQENADFCIISVGINDIPMNRAYPNYAKTIDNMKLIITTYHKSSINTKLIVTSIPYVGVGFKRSDYRNNHVDRLNIQIKDICIKNNIIFYDLNRLLAQDGYLNPRYDDGNHVHYNDEAYDLIIKEYIKLIEGL